MRTVVTILLCFTCYTVFSQSPVYFEKFNYRQGLSHQNIRCLFKDRQGFLWLGTDFGLNRYDGIGFKKWFSITGDTTSLPHNVINSIAQDKNGYIWMATGNSVASMDPYTGVFTRYGARQGIPDDIPNYDVNVFVDTANNNVWIGTARGIYILGPARTLQQHIVLQLEPAGKKLNNYIADFAEAGDTMYVSTSYGLYAIHKTTFAFTHYLLPLRKEDDPNANALTRLCKAENGTIWSGSWFRGIVWLQPGKGLRYRNNAANGKLIPPVMDIESVRENEKEVLYCSSLDGLLKTTSLSVLHDSSLQYKQYLPDKNDPDAISHGVTTAIYKDELNNLWVGSALGLNKTKIRPGMFQNFSFRKIVKQGFPPLDIVPANTPGIYWIFAGPNNILYNKNTNQFSLLPVDGEKYSQRQLIKTDKDYYAASKYGLIHFDNQMRVQKIYDTSNTPSLELQHFNHAFYDSKKNIWLGSFRKGIVVFNTVRETFTHYLQNESATFDITGHDIETFFEDNKGHIWIGIAIGAIQYDPATGKFSLITPSTNGNGKDAGHTQCFYQTVDKKIFIGTRDGLFEYNDVTKTTSRILLNGQGISNNIYEILEDRHKRLWLTTKNGLLCYDLTTQQTRMFDQKDGLPVNDLGSAFYKFSDSAFAIGTENAVVIYNPLQALAASTLPSPVFAAINIEEKPVSLIENTTVSIAYNQSISFDFLSLNYFNTPQNQYQYIVEGLDDDWKKIGNDHSLRFSNLPAGTYTVKVKAADSDGEWNKDSLSFSFRVTPPFYKTWWFIACAILTLSVAGYMLYKYRLQQVVRVERLRTRIATDLHDDIGATLSSISFYSEAIKQKAKEKLPEAAPILEKMGETSRSMVSSMSDIVWAINPLNDDMGKMLNRMQSYAAELCAIKNITLQVAIDDKTLLLKPQLEQRRNIHLVFKEALNNALKYSGASLITFSALSKGGLFILRLHDNGKGFDPLKETDGNGLKNMKRRSAEIGASLKIKSTIDEGTLISLELHL